MRYKAGDKVRIINNKNGYGHRTKYIGQTVTVKHANPNGERTYDEPHYSVKEAVPFVFFESELAPVNTQKIVITSDGTETLARLYDGNKVVKKATAKCSPDDTFDFKTGAMLAFERLMNEVQNPLKFEIGKQYQRGDLVIKITSAKRTAHSVRYFYDVIKGDAGIISFFDEDSDFGKELKPYEPPKYYNGKVVCIRHGIDLTVGKVYEFIDGKLIDDAGEDRPCPRDQRVRTETLDNGWARGKFIPLVE